MRSNKSSVPFVQNGYDYDTLQPQLDTTAGGMAIFMGIDAVLHLWFQNVPIMSRL